MFADQLEGRFALAMTRGYSKVAVRQGEAVWMESIMRKPVNKLCAVAFVATLVATASPQWFFTDLGGGDTVGVFSGRQLGVIG